MDQSSKEPHNELDSIERLLERFERRLRVQRAVAGIVEGACLGLMIGGVGIAAIRTGWAQSEYWWVWVLVALSVSVAASLFRAFQSIDTVAAAQKLDRAHGLHDRLSTALALANRDDLSEEDSDFVRAQLRDALRHSDHVDPREAAPWRRPPDTVLLALVGVAVLTIGIIPMNDHEEPLPDPFEVQHAPVLDDATVAMERDRLNQFRRNLEELPDAEAEEMADAIEGLLDAVENREISDREFAERIDELVDERFADTEQQRQMETMAEALADAAEQTAAEQQEALEAHPELQKAMEAMERGDLQDAADELAELAERIENEELDEQESSRLASVLESFASHLSGHEDRLQDLYERHRDAFEDLAQQFDGDISPSQEQLLEDAREAMEEAADRRENFGDSNAKNQLDQLQRELEQSADDLRQQSPGDSDGDDAPDSVDQADIEAQQQPGEEGEPDGDEAQPSELVDDERMGQDDQEQQREQPDADEPDYRNEVGRQLQDASDQLEQMEQQRERQRQREEAREQLKDLRESMARSDADGDERDEQRGEQMEDFMDRARGEAEDRQRDSDRPEGQEEQEGLERQGEPGDATDSEHSEYEGGDEETERGSGAGDGGSEDEAELADEDLDFDYTEEELTGIEAEQGATRSEIIQTASEEGFATADYQDVYADYEEIAAEVMDRDEVPAGYRHYVERYFQMIRPQQ